MDIPFNAASFSPGVPAGQMHPHELRVDTVNGKKLKRPITVVLTNAELLGDQTRCVLRGYEVGATVGIPAEVTRKEKAFTEHYGTGQGELRFRREFVVTSVVEPKGIKLKARDDGRIFIIPAIP